MEILLFRNTGWNEKPIQFGDQVTFVCERGYSFEEDPAQVDGQ
jgi:hypothetical protein